jgi:hypothetical protein
MVERHFQCSLCKKLFRNDSGLEWHLIHRHELAQAIEVIKADYEGRLGELTGDNAAKSHEITSLKTEADRARFESMRNTISVIEALRVNVELDHKINMMQDGQSKMILGLILRDAAMERELGRPLPISLNTLFEALEKLSQQKQANIVHPEEIPPTGN